MSSLENLSLVLSLSNVCVLCETYKSKTFSYFESLSLSAFYYLRDILSTFYSDGRCISIAACGLHRFQNPILSVSRTIYTVFKTLWRSYDIFGIPFHCILPNHHSMKYDLAFAVTCIYLTFYPSTFYLTKVYFLVWKQ